MSRDKQEEQRLRDAIMAELHSPQPQFNMVRQYINELESVNLRVLRGVDDSYTLMQLDTMMFLGYDIYCSMLTLENARITTHRYVVFQRLQKLMEITLTHSRPPADSNWTSYLFAKIERARNWPDPEDQALQTRAYHMAINLISEHTPGITKAEMPLLKTSFGWLE